MTTNFCYPKRPYWYMVLATLVLLTCFSNSPETINSKANVAGSSDSQHVHDVDQIESRVKRYLRSTSSSTQDIDGYNEERRYNVGFLSESTIAEVTATMWKGFDYLKAMVAPTKQEVTDKYFMQLGVQAEIDKDKSNPFGGAQFRKWAEDGKKVYKDLVEAEVAKISTLLPIYKNNGMVNMIAAGKNVLDTEITAKNLEVGLLIKWTADDKRVDDIFKLLNLDEGGSEVLASPLLKLWIIYAIKMDKKPYELLFAKLAIRKNDGELAELLYTAKKNDASKKIAEQLEKLVLKKWRSSHKSAGDVYNLLGLPEVSLYYLLKTPKLSTWISYMELLGKDPYDRLFLMIMRYVDDITLANTLAESKRNGADKKIIEKMEDRQLHEWSSKGKRGGDVFRLLKLNDEGNKMLGSELWSTLVSYMAKLEKDKNGTALKKTVLSQVIAVLKDEIGDEALLELIATAKTVEKTKEYATKMEPYVWKVTGLTAKTVFVRLKLKEKGKAVFESPEFKSWFDYVTLLIESNNIPDDFVQISMQNIRYLQNLLNNSNEFTNKARVTELLQSLTLLEQKKVPKKHIWTWLQDKLHNADVGVRKIWCALVIEILKRFNVVGIGKCS